MIDWTVDVANDRMPIAGYVYSDPATPTVNSYKVAGEACGRRRQDARDLRSPSRLGVPRSEPAANLRERKACDLLILVCRSRQAFQHVVGIDFRANRTVRS